MYCDYAEDDYLILRFVICIPASALDAAVVDLKGIKMLSVNGLTTFFINGSPIFDNGPTSLQRNPPDYTILDNRVFDNLLSADEWFAKALRRIETFLLVGYSSSGKLILLSESPIIFDDNLKTTSVLSSITDYFSKLWIW